MADSPTSPLAGGSRPPHAVQTLRELIQAQGDAGQVTVMAQHFHRPLMRKPQHKTARTLGAWVIREGIRDRPQRASKTVCRINCRPGALS